IETHSLSHVAASGKPGAAAFYPSATPLTFSFTPRHPPVTCARMKNINNSVVLSELLSPATINLNLRSLDRDSVLQELVNQIPERAKQPDAQQTLLRALHDREQLHSTGIGDGIALPHARNALVGL